MKSLVVPERRSLIDARELVYSPELLEKAPLELVYLALDRDAFEDLPVFVQNADQNQIAGVFYLHSWVKDVVDISRFFELISVLIEHPDLLIKAVGSLDMSYFSLVVVSEIQLKIFDEKQEFVDEDDAYTIDGGYTWITIKSQDPDRAILVRRLIDYLTGTNQLLQNFLITANFQTPSELWENAIKHREEVFALAELPTEDLRKELLEGLHFPASYDFQYRKLPSEVGATSGWYPIDEIIARVDLGAFKALLRNIIFSVLVEEGFPLNDLDLLQSTERYVLATINLGLQKKLSAGYTVDELADLVVVKEAFKIGMFDLRFFRQKFSRVDSSHWSLEMKTVLDAFMKFPPQLPTYFSEHGLRTIDNRYAPDLEFISDLRQLKALKQLLLEVSMRN